LGIPQQMLEICLDSG